PTPTRRCGTSSWPRTGRPEPRAMSDENRGVLPHLDRRSLLRAGGALAVGAGALGGAAALGDLVSAATAPRGVEPEGLRIGYLPSTDAAPLLVAHGDGLYEQQKLIVGHPVLFRSWSSLMEAFLTRQVDVIHLLMPSAIQLRHVVGADVRVVSWNHTGGGALTVAPPCHRDRSARRDTGGDPGLVVDPQHAAAAGPARPRPHPGGADLAESLGRDRRARRDGPLGHDPGAGHRLDLRLHRGGSLQCRRGGQGGGVAPHAPRPGVARSRVLRDRGPQR